MNTADKAAMLSPTARLMIVLGSTVAYFGLAILGWRGLAAFLSHPALIALAVVTAVMAIVSYLAGGNLSPGVREDRGNRWVITVFTLVGLLDGYLPAYTDRIGFLTIDGEMVRWLGVVLEIQQAEWQLLFDYCARSRS